MSLETASSHPNEVEVDTSNPEVDIPRWFPYSNIAEIFTGKRYKDSNGTSFGTQVLPENHPHSRRLDYPLVRELVFTLFVHDEFMTSLKMSGGSSEILLERAANDFAGIMQRRGISSYFVRHGIHRRHTPPHKIVECDPLYFEESCIFYTSLNRALKKQYE